VQDLIADLGQIVHERLGDWPADWEGYHWPGYTWEHTLRVRALTLRLAREAGADESVLALAALLHDIEKQVGRGHALAGARTAERLLRARGVEEELVERVCFAIATHAGENTPEHPLENRLLGDADLIDANFGLVGTWRLLTIRAGHGSTPPEAVAAIPDWLPKKRELVGRLHTDVARAVARERVQTMERFCRRLTTVFEEGSEAEGLREMVCLIHAQHRRASLAEQLPALREIGQRRGDAQVLAACARLQAEIAGEK